jgi:hypothetical protein
MRLHGDLRREQNRLMRFREGVAGFETEAGFAGMIF